MVSLGGQVHRLELHGSKLEIKGTANHHFRIWQQEDKNYSPFPLGYNGQPGTEKENAKTRLIAQANLS
jgi:hypothetical protein